MDNKNIYDVIIIGGGAAGLFCAATYSTAVNGLILEKTKFTGRKLLMSGGGQCNITHGGDIKEFLSRYGENGKKIRTPLYKFNNQAVKDFFETKGVPMVKREDGKVFPQSLDARDVLDVIRHESSKNGFKIMHEHSVCKLEPLGDTYRVICQETDQREKVSFECKKVVVATGGCSYATTGSDGSMFSVLAAMGLEVVKPKAALVPIFVENYPYEELSGISFSPAAIKVGGKENKEDLLLTHTGFSGPGAINISRFVNTGDKITINYFPGKGFDETLSELKGRVSKNSKQAVNFLVEYLGTAAPRRFIEVICKRASIDESKKASSLSGDELRKLAELLTRDTFSVSGLGGFNVAMVTAGGVALNEVDLKTMECRKYPKMFVIGEALNVDGDTGGYNLQFACSSGYLAGNTKV